MNAKQKIEAIAKEKAGHKQTLENLQLAMDAAADIGDLAEVKRVQSEIAAVQSLVDSCDRRAEKLKDDLIAEQKVIQLKANADAMAKFKDASNRLPPRAVKIGEIVAALADELKAFHADAREAADGAYILVKQADVLRPHDYLYLCGYTSFTDNVLGHCLGDELRKAGIFTRLAPHGSLRFERLDLPPIGEVIESRVENLTKRVEQVLCVANESLK